MNCIEYSELISAYVDEMLSPQEEEKLMRHLKTCQSCQEELESLKQLQRMCHLIEEVSLPDTFHEELMQRLECEKKVKPLLQWKWQYGGALVATMMVGIIFWNQLGSMDFNNEIAIEYTIQSQVAEARVQDETSPIIHESQRGNRTSLAEEIETWSIWKVQVENSEIFMKDLKAYLDKEQIIYEPTESGIRMNQVQEDRKLMKWLKEHSTIFEGDEMISKGNIQLEIQ